MLTDVLTTCALVIGGMMILVWLISILVHDASLVDLVWGLGFVLVAVTAAIVGQGSDRRQLLLVGMVGIWGLRLSIYLAVRNLGNGEDFRYAEMRRRWGDQFAMVSLVQVYLLQGVLMFVVSLPVQLSAASLRSNVTPLAGVGLALWAVGFFFEAVGDYQLARFKADDANAGQVMDQGLWRYTRHPNYFGDFCVWWGIYLVAAETEYGRWAFVGPLLMSFLLLRVSGVAMLERSIGKRRPGYDEYVARTSAFFPRPPKSTP